MPPPQVATVSIPCSMPRSELLGGYRDDARHIGCVGTLTWWSVHQAAAAGKPDNAAQLPGNHLASGQSATKLKEDLFSAANSIELFKEMLAPITPQGAADVKQVRFVRMVPFN